MSLTKEQIETRKASLQEDLQKNNEQIQKMLKAVDEARREEQEFIARLR